MTARKPTEFARSGIMTVRKLIGYTIDQTRRRVALPFHRRGGLRGRLDKLGRRVPDA
jgi:hypothetical protein